MILNPIRKHHDIVTVDLIAEAAIQGVLVDYVYSMDPLGRGMIYVLSEIEVGGTNCQRNSKTVCN